MTKCLLLAVAATALLAQDAPRFEYRVLATTKTSTMEKELNEAAQAGYVFRGVMGGESAFGGKEVLVVMAKNTAAAPAATRTYKLLAAARTSTMQRELQQAGDEGFDYCGQTVFESAFGGREVTVILERDPAAAHKRVQFRLLATSKTSTMQRELQLAGADGFEFLGVVVGKTAFGGNEVVSILRKYPPEPVAPTQD